MPELILIAEDERDIQELLEYNLKQEGFSTLAISRGDQVLEAVKRSKPALVLLDLMMPGMSGIEICKRLRGADSNSGPLIIMITAKGAESDKIVGLELGADDYITKPFSPKEVMARVKAVLRRARASNEEKEIIESQNVRLDLTSHKAFVQNNELVLTFTEFKLLRELLKNSGRVMTRNQLMDLIMGAGVSVTDRAIDVHMASLRKKMGESADLIETVRGVGYRFKE